MIAHSGMCYFRIGFNTIFLQSNKIFKCKIFKVFSLSVGAKKFKKILMKKMVFDDVYNLRE